MRGVARGGGGVHGFFSEIHLICSLKNSQTVKINN